MLKPNPHYDGTWRRGLWEGLGGEDEVLVNGMNAPVVKGETLDLSLSPLSARWGHSRKMANYKPRRTLSLEPNHAGTLILDFLSPEG